MLFGDTVQETREVFFNSWHKYKNKQLLMPLEHEIVDVILAHPQYHHFLSNIETFQDHTFHPELEESNPFLHLGLHLAVREQIATDRPSGIKACHAKLMEKYHDTLEVEHLIMDCLIENLWLCQKNQLPPDEHRYMAAIIEQCK